MAKTLKSESNAKNALKSSGPKSALGKAASAQNARRHGVLSAQLILPSENRDEFDELVDQLQQEFKPEGLLENTLVERIAIALWRQRRLVTAESAEILLHQQTSVVSATHPICTTLNFKGHDVDVQNEWNGISKFDDPRSSTEFLAIAESWKTAAKNITNIIDLERDYPILHAELIAEAQSSELVLTELNSNEYGFVTDLLTSSFKYYHRCWQLACIRELVATYKGSLSLPKFPESMARYQSSLDNDLYKAMRALKDAQSWRFDRRLAEASGVVAES